MRKTSLQWFILGLGYQLQFAASLSISEAVAVIALPFIVFREYAMMKRSGVSTIFNFSIGLFVSCCLVCFVNDCVAMQWVRGLATCVVLVALVVYIHMLIRKNPYGIKWFFVGVCICLVINTFIFRRHGDEIMYGDRVEDIMGGALYWIMRINHFVLLPIRGWYLSIPRAFSVIAPFLVGGVSLLISQSGRSSCVIDFVGGLIMLLGGKRRKFWVSKHFVLFMILTLVSLPAFFWGYKALAKGGVLGTAALDKYERQTADGEGLVSLVLGGRMESFAGLYSCLERPVVGWGPWARDVNGNNRRFMQDFGGEKAVRDLMWRQQIRQSNNVEYVGMISTHSTIVQFWVWFGIAGLMMTLYWAFIVIRFLKQDISSVPEWFGWMALMIPAFFWDLIFSPFSDRIMYTLLLIACLYARAVRTGSCVITV